jgi:hypothetical protein
VTATLADLALQGNSRYAASQMPRIGPAAVSSIGLPGMADPAVP